MNWSAMDGTLYVPCTKIYEAEGQGNSSLAKMSITAP